MTMEPTMQLRWVVTGAPWHAKKLQQLWIGGAYPDPNRRGNELICDAEWRDTPVTEES